jgi:CheY-like chemotaxis protein
MDPESRTPKRVHVLIAEDDDEQRDALRAILAAEGHRVDVAEDGIGAVRKALQLEPEVVLMDLEMPDMSGGEAIREIRRRTGSRQRPYVIVMSAHGGARAREAAFAAGCNEFIVKPHDVRGALWAYAWRRDGS